jgi:tetratricopeptide (TPR) repeat protein
VAQTGVSLYGKAGMMPSVEPQRPWVTAQTESVRRDCSLTRQWRAVRPGGPFASWLMASFWLSTGLVYGTAAAVMIGQAATASQRPSSAIGELPIGEKDDLTKLENLETSITEQKFQDVVPGLTDYLKSHPESARAHYDLGYVFFRTHQLGPSLTELSASLKLDVRNAEAHKILGLVCTLVGRYDLGERELEAAAELKPDSPEIHYLLGRLYYTKGVYPLAKREFESAVHLDPSYMKAHNNLGLTMEILGNNSAALENYTVAAQLDQEQKLNSEWPYVYLSAFYNRQEKPDQALKYGEQALENNPKSDLAYFQMAKAYRSKGEWQETADAAQQAIAINSKTPDFYFVLSYALRKLGRSTESQQAMATFRKLQAQDAARAERRMTNSHSLDPSMVLRDDE